MNTTHSPLTPRPKALSLLALEPRLLFDASGLVSGLDDAAGDTISFADPRPFQAEGQVYDETLNPLEMLAGDLDGDGDLDAYLTMNRNNADGPTWGEIWFNDGEGRFSNTGQRLNSIHYFDRRITDNATLTDLDHDGDLDLFHGFSIWKNDGQGYFSLFQKFDSSVGHKSILGDLDGDGDQDLIRSTSGNLVQYRNDGTGYMTQVASYSLSCSTHPTMALGDLNGDGDLDLVVGQTGNKEGTSIWMNDGQGGLTRTGTLVQAGYLRPLMGDLDLDGDQDLYLADYLSELYSDSVWFNDGAGHFTKTSQFSPVPERDFVSWLGDLDLDGDLDAVVPVRFGDDVVLIRVNDGTGHFTSSYEPFDFYGSRFTRLYDVNGDGALDLLNSSTGEGIRVWLNTTQRFDLSLETGAVSEYQEGSPALAVAPDLTIAASSPLISAQLAITSGFVPGEDLLIAGLLPAGLTSAWNAELGVLTLSGQAAAADYQAALRAILFQNQNTDDPVAGGRTLTITLANSARSASDSVTVNVSGVNDAPVVALAPANQTTLEDASFSFTLPADAFADVDAGDTLTLSVSELPAWLSFDPATATFSGTPGNDDAGQVTLTVTATDAAGAAVSASFTLTVENVNDAPVVTTTLPEQTVRGGNAFSLALPANLFADVDRGDTLTLSAANLPAWLSFDAATGTFSGTPHQRDAGVYSIGITASDASGATATTSFTLNVVHACQTRDNATRGETRSGTGNMGNDKPVGHAASVHSAWLPRGFFERDDHFHGHRDSVFDRDHDSRDHGGHLGLGHQLSALRQFSREVVQSNILDRVGQLARMR